MREELLVQRRQAEQRDRADHAAHPRIRETRRRIAVSAIQKNAEGHRENGAEHRKENDHGRAAQVKRRHFRDREGLAVDTEAHRDMGRDKCREEAGNQCRVVHDADGNHLHREDGRR